VKRLRARLHRAALGFSRTVSAILGLEPDDDLLDLAEAVGVLRDADADDLTLGEVAALLYLDNERRARDPHTIP
jgi:hypothetical protein